MPEARKIRSGDIRAGALLISMIEDGDSRAGPVLEELCQDPCRAFVMGITGPPGAGKSSLVNRLVKEFREIGKKTAVIAVDPTSPVSGGAILGDRLRMQEHASDRGVFIRSMASRGESGGLSRAVTDTITVLDAMGFGIIIIETMGVGQGEYDIALLAHSTGILVPPGTGDGIQSVKAGILEPGDLCIVNKCDLEGAGKTAGQLHAMIETRKRCPSGWKPLVMQTCAMDGRGVKKLSRVFLSHFELMGKTDFIEKKRNLKKEYYFRSILKDTVEKKILGRLENSPEFEKALRMIESGQKSSITAAGELVEKIFGLNNKES